MSWIGDMFTRAERKTFPDRGGGYANQQLEGIEGNVRGDALAIEATGVVQSLARTFGKWPVGARGSPQNRR